VKDAFGMAPPAPPSAATGRNPATEARARHFGGMEPMHAARALDSKGMAAAVARGSR